MKSKKPYTVSAWIDGASYDANVRPDWQETVMALSESHADGIGDYLSTKAIGTCDVVLSVLAPLAS